MEKPCIYKLDSEDIASLPIQRYSAYRPWIDRIAEGEQNILSKEKVTGFMETLEPLGSKMDPGDILMAAKHSAGTAPVVTAAFVSLSTNNHFKTLSIVSSAQEKVTDGGVPVGANTGRMKAAAFWAKGSYILPDDIHQISDSIEVMQPCVSHFKSR